MAFIKGNFKKYIYKSDNGFTVGLFKVRDSDLDLKNKTITFTGYFSDLNEIDLYLLNGKIETTKYGDQFKADSYELIMPEDKDHIIDFLSSDLFKGIGEKKAIKIVDTLGIDALNIITNDYDALLKVKGVTKKQRDTIYNTLLNYNVNLKEVLNLVSLGFNMTDAISIQKLYKENLNKILNNPYQMIDDIKSITFPKIEKLKSKLEIGNTDINRIKSGLIYVMDNLSFKLGSTYLSYEELLFYSVKFLEANESIINEALTALIKEDRVLIDKDKYYKKEVYESEKYIALRLKYLGNSFKCNKYDDEIEDFENTYGVLFDKEQKKAITSALNNKISVITGGPGTGKTTIIKAIIEIYKKINKLSHLDLVNSLSLLAPTGRASKRMSEKTNFPSYTIHRFLKWDKENDVFMYDEYNKIKTDFVIIDEASMLDNNLFYNLLLALEEDTKILLIGDHNQLPSVGSGQVLKDIIESDIVSISFLNKIYRTKEGSNISILAHDIINNNLDMDLFNKEEDLTFVECNSNNLKDVLKEFIETYKDVSIYDIEVLAPLYKGTNGIDALNMYIESILNNENRNQLYHNGIIYKENDKVINLVNNVEDNIFNGDIGIIMEIKKDEMIIDFDTNIVHLKKKDFDNIHLAYTISIHKAQGSEFDIVIIPILNSYNGMLYKKLIYTAVSRAKRKLIIIGEKDALKKAVMNDRENKRKTSLKKFLIDSIINQK